jgi:allantoinase
MPLNSIPPTTTPDALRQKREAADGACRVDVGFWGGAIPMYLGLLAGLHAEGVFGFKAFLCPSGVDEFPSLDLAQLRSAMEEIAAFDGLLIVHAELPGPIDEATQRLAGEDPFAYATYLASRPERAEEEAIAAVVEAAAETGCRAHVLHLSAASALPLLRDAPGVSAETCPHYLTFAAEEIEAGRTDHKCAPPIREASNRERLWDGLREGAIRAVVSDHSPCPPDLKAGSFFDAWGGIASLQLGLRVVWTGARARGCSIEDVARWMSAGPAAVAGLERKGAIAEGRDADLVLFDPDASGLCDPGELYHRSAVTPYAWRPLDGRVAATYLRGQEVYANRKLREPPVGALLTRGSG